jgi:two-component system, LytTR family, response regulator
MERGGLSESSRILIVDDEPLARALLRVLLEREGGVQVVGECSGATAVAEIAWTRPDILFLDVQMPEVDGFEVLARLDPQQTPVVVFVTAYDRYAVRAFEVHAVDYLLKPVDADRFREALRHARARVAARRGAAADPGLAALLQERARYPSRLLVPARGRTLVVEVAAIDWIEATDYYASIHTGAQTHLLRQTMAQLERILDPSRFFRVHRSAIVNLERVREIRPLFRGDSSLLLATGARVRLSRTRRSAFQRLFAAAVQGAS